MVEAPFLQHLQPLLDGAGVGGGAQGPEAVVVGDAFPYHLLPVEFEAEVGAVLNGAHAEAALHLVGHATLLVAQLSCQAVEMGRLATP